MPNYVQRAARAPTRPSAGSSNTGAASRWQNALQPLLSPEQTEGAILRMAAVLSADATRSTVALREHVAYVGGALALAVSLGLLTDHRALEVRKACLGLFDGARHPAGEHRADPAFAAMVSAVRRNGGASTDAPLPMAELTRPAATAMLGRLMAAGIVGAADLTGFHPVIAGEC